VKAEADQDNLQLPEFKTEDIKPIDEFAQLGETFDKPTFP